MPYFEFIWTPEIEEHIGDNGISPDEFEEVVSEPSYVTVSRSSGLPAAFGWTSTGKFIFCVYREINSLQIEPVTAFEV